MTITEKTITNIFMVPTLGIPREELIDNNLINAYLGDINKEEYHEDDVVFLLFKPNDIKKFRAFVDKQYNLQKGIIDDYDYDDGYVVLVYVLDMINFGDDFDLIKDSKYSKTSSKFKNQFNKTVKLINRPGQPEKTSLQWLIFTKDESLIDYVQEIIGSDIISKYNLEVWPAFDPKKEVLDIDNIINKK